jgi:hypothetical protein
MNVDEIVSSIDEQVNKLLAAREILVGTSTTQSSNGAKHVKRGVRANGQTNGKANGVADNGTKTRKAAPTGKFPCSYAACKERAPFTSAAGLNMHEMRAHRGMGPQHTKKK